MVTSRQLRLLRGAAASSAATIIAAVSHTIGGGTAPHPLLILALSVFLTPVAALLVGRRPSLAKLSAAVLLSQGVFHVLFVALNATATPTIAGSGHQHTLTFVAIADDAVPGAVAPDAGADVWMLSAHLLAGIVTIALLWHGESMLRAIARWVRTALRVQPVPQPQRDWPVPASIARTARVFVEVTLVGDVTRRGPPVLSRA